MKINISLPRPINSDSSTEGVKSFLKQLELSVHHAQKSLEEMVRMAKESGKNGEFAVMYRVENIENSQTGDRYETENAYTDDIEIEIYEA